MPPVTPFSPARKLVLAGALGAALFTAQVHAANTPLPHIAMDVKRTQTKTQQTDPNGSNNDDNNGSGGSSSGHSGGYGGMGGGGVVTRSNEIYYVITLNNLSSFAAQNVEVDYIIYNRTRTTTKGKTTSTVDQITGSETVDVSANGAKDVETNKVPHQQQQATTTKSSSKYGGGNNTPKSVTTQSVAGVWVQAKIGDAVVGTYEDPPDIKSKMEEQAKKGSKSGSSDDMDSMDSSDSSSDSSN